MRLRECLLSFVGETRSDDLVPDRGSPPKASNFKAWSELLANFLAPGDSASALRSYLRKMAIETWDYVNWLTHAKNAVRLDAEFGLKAVEHALGAFTAARLRSDRVPLRCEDCGSYRVVAGRCAHCGWDDASYQPPESTELDEQELARRLAEPCTPSSDISTFISPNDG